MFASIIYIQIDVCACAQTHMYTNPVFNFSAHLEMCWQMAGQWKKEPVMW